ncbi:MAG: methyltransferase type 11 [Alphaproteobacteria bacterium]|nr:methyltransferase type 11 [Alphaproteobacteria bacterium]
MELPPGLKNAVDRALEGVALRDIASAASALSERYRGEVRDGRLHLGDTAAARAYLATRLPATYAAVHASLAATAQALPDFAPRTLLDAGAGPGTVMWAAAAHWPDLTDALLLEASPTIRSMGEELSAPAGVGNVVWRDADLRADLPAGDPCDLVTLAYVLDELAPADRDRLIDRLWVRTSGVLLIVEPGTPKGWERMLAARTRLLGAGAHIVAPCPHAQDCPLVAPDWCHFAARVARSRIHRQAKGGEVPWEDEKFIYLAASRAAPVRHGARIIAPPEAASGRVGLKLCQADGSMARRLVTRREGEVYKAARRSDWGDMFG